MIEVERYSFFDVAGGGSLRYAEHAPVGSGTDHSECGCTKNVDTRPTGKPTQVHQEFTLVEDDVRVQLARRQVTFLGAEEGDASFFLFGGPYGHHEKSVKVQIRLPGYGFVGAFFANLYYGSDINIDRFMNGHSPSKIFGQYRPRLTAANAWVHDCSWGHEAIRLLAGAGEIEVWWEVFERMNCLDQRIEPYRHDSAPVEELRARLEEEDGLPTEHARKVVALLRPLVKDIRSTNLFRCVEEIFAEIHPDITAAEMKRSREMFDKRNDFRTPGGSR